MARTRTEECKTIPLRLQPDVYAKLEAERAREHRSRNAQLEYIVENYFNKQGAASVGQGRESTASESRQNG